MADVKWTIEQENAIKIRDSKTLIAAGAGSGKTAVLVERIISKVINDGVDIDKMLIVTFTNAAASEMKERIRDRLYEEALKNHEFQKQILYLNRASIMTIDAFCKKAVKDYFYKLDIDPNFKIADNTELELLKMETVDEVLEELYESNDEEMIDVLDSFSSNKSDESLVNLIMSIHKFIQSCPYPLEWLNEKCEMYNIDTSDFSNTLWGKYLIRHTRKIVEELSSELSIIKDSIENDEDAKNYFDTIQDDIFVLDALRKNNITWDDYYNEFQKIEFSRLKNAPKMALESKEYIQSIRKKMKKNISEYLRDSIFISPSSELLKDLKKAYRHVSKLKDIIFIFDEKLSKKKEDKNILDFSDIEHLCLKLFNENEEVLNDYKNKYQEILIDEYQDSNLIQETILNKISNGNIFMVGDVKQSIYKFRQARPELFLEKYSSYLTWNGEDTHPENKILLFKNFRSNKNIINQINFIFKNIMSEENGEIDYTEEEYLKFGAEYYNYDGDKADFILIDKKDNSDSDDDEEISEEIFSDDDIDEKSQLEARVVANKIKNIVGNFEVYDKTTKAKRKAKYSDIVILFRATKGYADVFANELNKYDIPVYSDVRTGYFDNSEVQVILSLLKIIDNPYQDIPLISVLRSPIGGFDVNELTRIRLYNKEVSFFEALMIAKGNGEQKVINFLNRLEKWREKSRYLTINELLLYLFDETKYYYFVALLPNGEGRQNNLKVLLKKSSEYEKSSFKGLYNFLNFIDNVKMNSGDLDSPSTLSENDDVVRIMSIHKSKGLEFPIVILSGTSRPLYRAETQNRIVLNQEMGLGIDIVDSKNRFVYESVSKLAIKLQNKKESLAEEMRILYVALTRAKEKLIVTSLVDKADKKIDDWSKSFDEYTISTSTSLAEWVGRAILHDTSDFWNIEKWSYNEAIQGYKNNESPSNVKNNTKIENIFTGVDSSIYNFIKNRFNYKYPFEFSTKIPAKLSVSEIKRLNQIDDISEIRKVKELIKPEFINEEKIVGAKYGTLLHNKMEKIDFKNPNIDELLKDVEDENINIKLKKDISKFLNSNLYYKILSSSKINREMPFNLNLSINDVFSTKEIKIQDIIMIQGIIDLYFETKDGIILVDYKTDKIEKTEDLKIKYCKQLEYYKLALEQLTGKKVIETYIYSFNLAKEILM